jgi:hypothetical protein
MILVLTICKPHVSLESQRRPTNVGVEQDFIGALQGTAIQLAGRVLRDEAPATRYRLRTWILAYLLQPMTLRSRRGDR